MALSPKKITKLRTEYLAGTKTKSKIASDNGIRTDISWDCAGSWINI